MRDKIRSLILDAVDGTISAEDFEVLQNEMEQDEEVLAEYLRAVGLVETLGDIAAEENSTATTGGEKPVESVPARAASGWDVRSPRLLMLAAAVVLMVGGMAFWVGHRNGPRLREEVASVDDPREPRLAGHATLRHAVDLKWSDGAETFREGDVLPAGVVRFDEGVAEIDFFCGATLIVEGPAELSVESDWAVGVVRGRLRANVPPAARGFVVNAAGSKIVDLGTEFALDVGADSASVEVIDGEIELRGGEHDGKHLFTGERRRLKGEDRPDVFEGLSTSGDLRRRRNDAEAKRFAEWRASSDGLREDPRLIAYFPIAANESDRVVTNRASTGEVSDGTLVGEVGRTEGRFGSRSKGLEFGRPGARVRTRIDGEFEAYTFACWVRIDGLDHRYNALFMGDGYENGEPHWQIRDDGRLMFSVMVDDTHHVEQFYPDAGRKVTTAGLHRVYFTEPVWDVSKSGQWFHIVAVYDPAGRRVVQYVNGEEVGSEEITDEYFIDTLRIGAGEIGNWGQPFRETPWFSVRNLNGTIDELAIFDAALSADEVHALYEQGKPLGY